MPDGSTDDGLRTLGADGQVPETRMRDAQATQDFVRALVQDDSDRSRVRAAVDGLVDGNPPLNNAKLAKAGRRDACNVNWGTARGYMESGTSAFHDLTSEAPGHILIQTGHGNDEQRVEWSQIMSEELDASFQQDADFKSDLQLSQNEMVLHFCGPLYFEDEFQAFPVSVETGDLKVPPRSRSKVSRWEGCVILMDYYPPELYAFIRDEAAAESAGWNVPFTRQVIANPIDASQPAGQSVTWEFVQQQIKEKALCYVNKSYVIHAAHVFTKEFDGRITHAIVQREDTTRSGTEDAGGVQFMYQKIGRYADFSQVIHPMYFDRGRGGYHHTVSGLGVKMYGPMVYENRLLCNLMDKAFAPKVFFKPTSAEATQKMQLATFGDWGVLPSGTEVVQNPIQGYLNEGMAMVRASSELMRSNLSQYRQTVQPEKAGNPDTAYERKSKDSQQGALTNTTFSRYYEQLDALYFEIARRHCNLNTTDRRAVDYQGRCVERGVPRECFGRLKAAVAVRVVGQGSPFMRQQVTGEMLPIMGRFSEEGQNNILNDYIASRAGQNAIRRYNPRPSSQKLASDQRERAMNQVAGMKTGLHPTITASQDALTFAATFLQACGQALQSVQQGAPPSEVLAFLGLAAPGCLAHLKRMASDPFRKPMAEQMGKQLETISQQADKLKALLAKQKQGQKEQQGKAQQAMSDAQVKQFKATEDAKLKAKKAAHQMQLKQQAHNQNLALNDSRTASEINLAQQRQKFAAFKE